MAEAYCPYCGVEIDQRGQSNCANCGENIIDIWKLLNSELPVETPRRTLPPYTPLAWLVKFLFVGILFVLIVMVGYLVFSRLLELDRLERSGAWNLPIGACFTDYFSRQRAAPGALAVFTAWLAPAGWVPYASAPVEPEPGPGQVDYD